MKRTFTVALLVATASLACNRIQHLPPRQGGAGEKLTIISRSISASTHGFRFLGILPLVFPSHAEASKEILVQAGADPHSPDYVLVNQVQQTNAIYLFVASVHTLTLTADVARIER